MDYVKYILWCVCAPVRGWGGREAGRESDGATQSHTHTEVSFGRERKKKDWKQFHCTWWGPTKVALNLNQNSRGRLGKGTLPESSPPQRVRNDIYFHQISGVSPGHRHPFAQTENWKQQPPHPWPLDVPQSLTELEPKLEVAEGVLSDSRWNSGTLGKSGRIFATRGSRRIWSDGRQFGRDSDEGSNYEVWMIWEDVLTREIYPLEEHPPPQKKTDDTIRKKNHCMLIP